MCEHLEWCTGQNLGMGGGGFMPPRSVAVQSHAPVGHMGCHGSAPSTTGASASAVQPAFHSAVPHSMGQADRCMQPVSAGSAVLANAEPPRGGQYDRQFDWSITLLEQNKHHFKNPSFRGCQEQVLFAVSAHAFMRVFTILSASDMCHMATPSGDAGHERRALWQGCVCFDANGGCVHINQLAACNAMHILDAFQEPVQCNHSWS